MRAFIAAASLALACLSAPATAQARVGIRIDLASQSMQVTDGAGRRYRWAISSGRRGFPTPTGVYASQRLARMHYSSKYDDAPMPHSIFFRGGYAIHGTGAVGLLGRPASHGCVRLSPGNAAALFSMVRAEGARIAIVGAAPADGRAYAGSARVARETLARRGVARASMRESARLRPSRDFYYFEDDAPGFIDAPYQPIDVYGAPPRWRMR